MLRVQGSKVDATASGVSATTLDASPIPTVGVVSRLPHRLLTPVPATRAYSCQRPKGEPRQVKKRSMLGPGALPASGNRQEDGGRTSRQRGRRPAGSSRPRTAARPGAMPGVRCAGGEGPGHRPNRVGPGREPPHRPRHPRGRKDRRPRNSHDQSLLGALPMHLQIVNLWTLLGNPAAIHESMPTPRHRGVFSIRGDRNAGSLERDGYTRQRVAGYGH